MPELSTLRRYKGRIETAFGQDESDQTMLEIRCLEASMRKADDVLRDEGIVQNVYTRRMHYLGRSLCEVNFRADMYTSGAQLNSAASAPSGPRTTLGVMLKAFLGGWASSNGSAVASGPATTGCVVTGGHGSRFAAGRAVGVVDGTHGQTIRWLKSVSTDTLAWKVALGGAPSVASAILNSETFFLEDDISETFQLMCQTAVDDWEWLAMGLQATAMTLDMPSNGIPRIGWTLRGADYMAADETINGTETLARGTYVDDDPPLFHGSALLFGTGGASAGDTTRTQVQHASITISPRWTVTEIPDVNGVNGIGGWKRTRPDGGAAATVELVVPIADDSYYDGFQAKTKYHLEGVIGNTPGEMWGIECPTLVQNAPPEETDINGMLYQRLSLECLEDENATDQSTALRRSPIRFGQV